MQYLMLVVVPLKCNCLFGAWKMVPRRCFLLFARLGIPMQCDFGRLIFAEKPVDLLKMQEIL